VKNILLRLCPTNIDAIFEHPHLLFDDKPVDLFLIWEKHRNSRFPKSIPSSLINKKTKMPQVDRYPPAA
jgi:hypothetical protein